MKRLLSIEKKQESVGKKKKNHTWKVNHLNKPVHRFKKNYCESDNNYNEQQKDKHEDVKKYIKITKCGEGE